MRERRAAVLYKSLAALRQAGIDYNGARLSDVSLSRIDARPTVST